MTKDLQDQFIEMNIKQKVIMKIQQTNSHIFSSQILFKNRLFVLVYTNEANNAKRFKARKCYLPKAIIRNYNVINNGKKTFMTK